MGAGTQPGRDVRGADRVADQPCEVRLEVIFQSLIINEQDWNEVHLSNLFRYHHSI